MKFRASLRMKTRFKIYGFTGGKRYIGILLYFRWLEICTLRNIFTCINFIPSYYISRIDVIASCIPTVLTILYESIEKICFINDEVFYNPPNRRVNLIPLSPIKIGRAHV